MSDPEPRDREAIGAGGAEPAATVADLGTDGPPDTRGRAPAHEVDPGQDAAGATLAHEASPTATGLGDATPADRTPSAPAHRPAPTIAGYEVEGELGRGAMGVVYRARQVRLNRPCALKVILAGAHVDPVAAVRFLGEAEAVARLQHPNIVQIHHIGEADGLPFFELEYVEGGSLDRRLDGTPWPARRAATLIEALARGVAEAHRLGIVHRDLKPSNILIAADGTPKIADFGLAKSLNVESGLTATESILGSPSYMAPEQAGGKARQVGPLADVYALGAVLYELLVGRPPFRGTTVLETLEQVKTAEPVRPSRLVPGVPRDAETIALKCLQKDPAKRYASAEGLAEDLRRFLAGEPILARRTGPVERAWRWCRRNPAVASLWAALVGVLLAGTATATYYAVRASERAESLRRQDYVGRVNLAYRECLDGNVARALKLLDGCPADLRGWEWDYAWRQCHLDLHTFPEPGGQSVNGVAFSPDSTRVACVSGAYDFDRPGLTGDLVVRDVATHREVFARRGVASGFRGVAFSPDGRQVATGNAADLVVWDLATGEKRLFRQTAPGTHSLPLRSLAYSPDGRQIIAGYGPSDASMVVGHARLWDAETGTELGETIPGHPGGFVSVAFSPDGREVALASEGFVELYVLGTRRPVLQFRGHKGPVFAVAFSPDGRTLASGGFDQTVRLWDRATGDEIEAFHGHESFVRSLAFYPKGRSIISAGEDNRLMLWEVTSGRRLATFQGHQNHVTCVAFSPDGRYLASGDVDHAVKLWLATESPQLTFTGHDGWVFGLAFSPDGHRIASGGSAFSTRDPLKLWDATTGVPLVTFAEGSPQVTAVAFRRDGRRLAAACRDGTVRIWDANTGRLLQTLPQQANVMAAVAYSPDGRYLATACTDIFNPPVYAREPGEVKLWDADSGQEIRTLGGHTAGVFEVTFSPDGRYLASACADGIVRIWDTTDPSREARPLRGHAGHVRRVVFLPPDGRRLATAGGLSFTTGVGIPLTTTGGEVKIWDLATGRVLYNLIGHSARVRGLASSSDGRRLATASDDRTIKLWDTRTGEEVFTLRGHTAGVLCVAFSPDGRRIASGGIDLTARVWDTSPPTVGALFRRAAESRVQVPELPDNPFAP